MNPTHNSYIDRMNQVTLFPIIEIRSRKGRKNEWVMVRLYVLSAKKL